MKNAFITGGSSGIGFELGRELAKRGYRVALSGRRAELLEANVESIRRAGGEAIAVPADVTDHAAVKAAVARVAGAWGAIDLAVANAGVGIPTRATRLRIEDAEITMRVNFFGMLYLFDAVIPAMIERRSGRFVGIASLAGLRGLPNSSMYSASKAAMQTFLEASRIELAPTGVGVTTVNPGFVATPMTEKNKFPMPFLQKADRAARIIADGIERGKREIEFPRRLALVVRAGRLLPNAIYDRVTSPYSTRQIAEGKIRR
jgi:Short-chain dehydrogenases of various substrate specificities